MRRKVIAGFLVLLAQIIWSCSTYKPIEKVTQPTNPKLTSSESLWRQLAYLKPGDQISIKTDNGKEFELVFKSVTKDTLFANFQKPKQAIPIKIHLDRIQQAKVEEFNLEFTLIGLAILIPASIVFLYSALNTLEFF